jgi:hypothetical protein
MSGHKSISLLANNISRRQLMITTGMGLSTIIVGQTVGSARGNAQYRYCQRKLR